MKQRATSPQPQLRPSSERARGTVLRLYPDRGFGFIRCTAGTPPEDLGQDYFFHASGLSGCAMTELEIGGVVDFEPRVTAKGRRAEGIVRV